MTNKTLLVAFVCVCVCVYVALPAAAQSRPNPDVQREAMKKLAFLAGRWTGDASVTLGPAGPKVLAQTEDVAFKLDGLVLLVEGTGRNPQSGAVEFNALAIVSYDDLAKTYRIRAYNGGNYLETEIVVRERGFEWGYTAGPAVVKNVMTLDDAGRWVEFTDVVVNNGPPRRTVEIRVRK
jgi:hypothetical protein